MKMNRLTGQLGILLFLVGFVVMFLGWNGAASYTALAAQFPYLISGGVLGLSFVVIGAALIVVQNSRNDRVMLQQSLERLTAAVERSGSADYADHVDPDQYVVVGGASYHRMDCALPEGSDDARLARIDEVDVAVLSPCRVCQPPAPGRHLPSTVDTVSHQ